MESGVGRCPGFWPWYGLGEVSPALTVRCSGHAGFLGTTVGLAGADGHGGIEKGVNLAG